MICACGYEYPDELGRYGCPNCEGDAMSEEEDDMKDLLILVALLAGGVYAVKAGSESEWYLRQRAEAEAREEAGRTPHVIREKDGCKVYRFKADDGRYQYFTRCPNAVTTTEQHYTESCGPKCSREAVARITTQ